MLTFKPGDRVRCIDAKGTDLVRGRIYVIVPYQISVDSAGLSDPSLVYVRREGRAEGYWRERFQPIEAPPLVRRRAFRAGDRVRCIKDRGCCWLREGQTYFVEEVTARGGLLRLRGRPCHDGYLPCRFKLVAAPAPFTPHIGTLDGEYGPATEAAPVNPIFNAIGKKWSSHPSDAVIQLDELHASRSENQ